MQSLFISNTNTDVSTPSVEFDADTGICVLAGEAFMEQPYFFYKPLYDWLDKYIKEVQKPIYFDIKLTYFNTSSSKFVLDILRLLKKYELSGGTVKVKWFLRKADEDMQEEIEDFTIVTGLAIELISV